MNVFKRDKITVRLLENNDDVTLAKWLSDPQVLEYYEGRDRPHDVDLVREHYYNRDEGEALTACIIQYDGIDIGYIQFYPINEEERILYGYGNYQGKIYGMDQFIGEPDFWNRGIGTELIKGMVEYLVNEEQADLIVMDPQVWNLRALRVYEKCGFKQKKFLPKHEWHEGEFRDCWVIEYNPAIK
jgi:aminoglycoside 6'-N-acetyltransferase